MEREFESGTRKRVIESDRNRVGEWDEKARHQIQDFSIPALSLLKDSLGGSRGKKSSADTMASEPRLQKFRGRADMLSSC